MAFKDGNFVAITKCFYCGNEKNEIIMDTTGKDISEIHGKIIDYVPCDTCKSYMEQGIILIGVKAASNHENPFRTGVFSVIKEEAFERIFGKPAPEYRWTFVEHDVLHALGITSETEEDVMKRINKK